MSKPELPLLDWRSLPAKSIKLKWPTRITGCCCFLAALPVPLVARSALFLSPDEIVSIVMVNIECDLLECSFIWVEAVVRRRSPNFFNLFNSTKLFTKKQVKSLTYTPRSLDSRNSNDFGGLEPSRPLPLPPTLCLPLDLSEPPTFGGANRSCISSLYSS